MQCLGIAHQFLSKPCDPQVLKIAVTRAFATGDLLQDEAIRKTVFQLSAIPSLPALYAKVIEQLQSPQPSIGSVAQLIASDPGMTAKILQVVNFAFFGSRRQISNPAEAVMLVGLDTIRSMALSTQVLSPFPQQDLPEFSIQDFSTHSLATGLLAREIISAENGDAQTKEQAMAAGLLHDIGKLILVTNQPRLFAEAQRVARERNVPVWQVEREIIGADHAEVGGALLGLWGLPFELAEAVTMHHRPSGGSSNRLSALTAVHVANVLQRRRQRPRDGTHPSEIEESHLVALGLEDRLKVWETLVEPTHNSVANL
jgi:HD-like signal output (HDOD) protein